MKIFDIKRATANFQRERLIGEINVYLPEPPKDYKKIANYDLKPKDQKFHPTKQSDSDSFFQQEFSRFKNGYWFFNNGNLEWITGCHYFFLNYWKDKSKPMKFMDAQRDIFLWWWQIEKMENMAGGNLVTARRAGKTAIATCIGYFRTTTNRDHRCGIQSKTNKDGKVVFGKLIRSWRKLPDWLRPTHSGESRPATILEFFEPRTRSIKGEKHDFGETLDSSIDFQSSEEDAYDGEELNTIIEDECHTAGVEVLMYDGTHKKVEDIKVGDLVMGDDSTAREVLELKNGKKECYEVVPNANGWDKWGCTENHLLSVIYANEKRQSKFKHKQVYNISVKDFLNLTPTDQKHFCLYKKQVDYSCRDVKIPPYILGIWLGDGSSWYTSITKPDKEIIDEWEKYSISLNHNFIKVKTKENKCPQYNISSKSKKEGANEVLNNLRYYGLIQNKHIPNDYLFNDRESRLQLLAGLIDTDGHLNKKGNSYEIVQKRKDLSLQIQRLALELGFKSNMSVKIATMKRKDGSVYSCEVYRIHIYGLNLYEIPCLVKRKIILKKDFVHPNTRDSLKTALKLVPIGEQEYFGFKLSGNNLYMLKDCTVTHNCGKTVNTNTDTRWGVLQLCLMDGAALVGKAIRTSTVEEMEKRGGKNLWATWLSSMLKTMSEETGRTDSMLTNLFIPADYGFKGVHPKTGKPFIDEYGYSNRELAREYIMATWANLSGPRLKAAQRKNPLNIKQAFQLATGSGEFDNELLEMQRDWLENSAPKNLLRPIEFYRDPEDGMVKWRNSFNGHCEIVWDFADQSQANQRKMNPNGFWEPTNTSEFCIGIDPVAATITTGDERSEPVAYVYRKGVPDDPDWSGMVIARFSFRTNYKRQFHQYIMMMCQYYGCKANYESDIDDYYEWFIADGFKNYVMWRPKSTIDPMRKHPAVKYGTPSKDPYAFQKHTQTIHEYILARWNKIYFLVLIEQLIKYDVEDRTKFDDVIAFGMSLLGGMDAPSKNDEGAKPRKFMELHVPRVNGRPIANKRSRGEGFVKHWLK